MEEPLLIRGGRAYGSISFNGSIGPNDAPPSEGRKPPSVSEEVGGGLVPVVGGGSNPERGVNPPRRGVWGVNASLDGYGPKRSKNLARNQRRRRKRAYQRIVSGLKRRGVFRFITLTSAPGNSPKKLGRQFYNLVKRLRYHYGKFEYVRVRVPGEGYGVIHALVLSPFIPQRQLSEMWSEIRPGSFIVDIRTVSGGKVGKMRVSNYIISQYISGQQGETWLSWSLGWVYPGFCRDWEIYKRVFGEEAVKIWGMHLKAFFNSLGYWSNAPPPWDYGIPDHVKTAFGIPV